MIQITQEESYALSILTVSVTNVNNELQKQLAGRQSMIKLLEDKYKAKFDEIKGIFNEVV